MPKFKENSVKNSTLDYFAWLKVMQWIRDYLGLRMRDTLCVPTYRHQFQPVFLPEGEHLYNSKVWLGKCVQICINSSVFRKWCRVRIKIIIVIHISSLEKVTRFIRQFLVQHSWAFRKAPHVAKAVSWSGQPYTNYGYAHLSLWLI